MPQLRATDLIETVANKGGLEWHAKKMRVPM
jgi:hypothetical protein